MTTPYRAKTAVVYVAGICTGLFLITVAAGFPGTGLWNQGETPPSERQQAYEEADHGS